MTIQDKLSETSKQQLARQIDFFQTLTARAFDNAERIVALNIEATRTVLEQTSGAVRQLATARDPRDLATLGAQSQQQMAAVMAYGRKLMEVTNKPVAPASASAPAPEPAPDAHIVTAEPVMSSEPVADTAPEVVAEPAAAAAPAPEPAASTVSASAHPMGEADPEPAPMMVATPTVIAQAVSEVASAPADTPHPAASPIPDAGPVVIPAIAPIDAVEPASAPQPKRSRGAKKR